MTGPRKKSEEVSETLAPKEPKLHVITLKRNYRPPKDMKFQVMDTVKDEDGEETLKARDPEGAQEIADDKGIIRTVAVGDYRKLHTGTTIKLPTKEAKRLVQGGLAGVAVDW